MLIEVLVANMCCPIYFVANENWKVEYHRGDSSGESVEQVTVGSVVVAVVLTVTALTVLTVVTDSSEHCLSPIIVPR
jgi:hypothetical protein